MGTWLRSLGFHRNPPKISRVGISRVTLPGNATGHWIIKFGTVTVHSETNDATHAIRSLILKPTAIVPLKLVHLWLETCASVSSLYLDSVGGNSRATRQRPRRTRFKGNFYVQIRLVEEGCCPLCDVDSFQAAGPFKRLSNSGERIFRKLYILFLWRLIESKIIFNF